AASPKLCASGSPAPPRWWPSSWDWPGKNMSDSTYSHAQRRAPEERTWPGHLPALLLDQQERWGRGECPTLETYLQQYPALAENIEDALTLLYHEVLLRERRGEQPEPADYERRFPEWAGAIREHFEIHEALSRTPTTYDP